jgi:hypothetical protein
MNYLQINNKCKKFFKSYTNERIFCFENKKLFRTTIKLKKVSTKSRKKKFFFFFLKFFSHVKKLDNAYRNQDDTGLM